MTINEIEIDPVETMEEAVAQGAALLDKYQPGWETTVRGAMTAGLFEMSAWESCMVGTLEMLQPRETLEDMDRIVFNGFGIPAHGLEARWVGFLPLERDDDEDSDDDYFGRLDGLWRAQVEKRTGESAAQNPPPPVSEPGPW